VGFSSPLQGIVPVYDGSYLSLLNKILEEY
jgi:hypothetical protein